MKVRGLDRVPSLVLLCKSHTHVFDFHYMLKRCIFSITDKDTGEIYGWFDKEYQLDEKSHRERVKEITSRFIEIAYEKQANIVASLVVRPPKDSVPTEEIPFVF